MGFWSTLAKIGGAVAAPFTGGGSLALTALGNVADVAGKAAAGRAEGRGKEADYLLQRDMLGAAENVSLDRDRMRQAILLSLMGGVQDAQVTPPEHIASRMPQLSGGLKPSAIRGREEIISAARPRILQSLMTGEHLPQLSAAPKAGILDKILSGVGLAGGVLGASRLGVPGQQPSAGVPVSRLLGQNLMGRGRLSQR